MTDRMIEKNPERGCEEFPNLLTPLTLRGLVLKNRMFSAPTSLAKLGENEHYSRENIDYYRYKAMGGCALVSVGDVIVDNTTGRSHPEQVGLDDSSHLPYLVKLADAIHSGGAAASVEILGHKGNDLWHKEELARNFLIKSFAEAGLELGRS